MIFGSFDLAKEHEAHTVQSRPKMPSRILFIALAIVIAACNTQTGDSNANINYADLSLHTQSGTMQAVIEIPAGTNQKKEYNYDSNTFPIDREVKYLPYPANYGFLPGTYMNPEDGGDGTGSDWGLWLEPLLTK